ncbi:hypothetical protein [Halorhabdus rudnickae]|uniref:hypothetical protein n=1 Tax=Halorhabdus rudnickae TaxID=1775544 RepID=UPI00108388C5|nr:hypothetical protein [Halorhabdus rudnickae]
MLEMNEDSESDEPGGVSRDKGLGERLQQTREVEQQILEERQEHRVREERERIESKAEDEPKGDLPGPHARILEPEGKELDGKRYLEFRVILPDRTYGTLRTEYPVPEPGPLLSLIYETCGYDPEEATPSDLFKADIPVRKIEDEPAEDCWVFDPPPDYSIFLWRNRLYKYRRELEERGIMGWQGESNSPGDEEETELREERLDRVKQNGIGYVLPHKPSIRSTWGWAVVLLSVGFILLGGAAATGDLPLWFINPATGIRIAWMGILLWPTVYVIRRFVRAYSVRGGEISPSLPTHSPSSGA